ncbi:YgaP family membrane protein [Methylobacter sp.]|uniref:YgaP family membrane protein n=1 Tax=Methylobacter sp. TaxID=2051955 RepID=UPI002FDE73CB
MSTSLSQEMDRVRRHSPPEINDRIDADIDMTVQRYTGASPEVLSRRIDELDREWDIERALETNAASVALLGLVLSRMHNRRWMWLSTGVAVFLLQHALQGWCPPISVFRRLGIRTQGEIDREKYILKALRGDFQAVLKSS